MKRFFLALVLFSFVSITTAQVAGPNEDDASPYAVTPEQKEALLKKAEDALLWYRSMGRETRLGAPSTAYRKEISPMELMQAAAILKEQNRIEMSRMLREMFPAFLVTPEECFEIHERLGDEMLDAFMEDKELLSGDATDSSTRIRQGSEKFLKDSLTPIERLTLMEAPGDAMAWMKAIELLAVSGRPMLVRYCLRQFLKTGATPEEYAKIAETIGSRALMQLAGNARFAPQGEEAVAKIFSEARKHWRDPVTVSEALGQWKGIGEDGKFSDESDEALHALWRGDRVSVSQLIAKLGETDDQKEADDLLAVLLSLGGDVKEALSESLRSDNPKLLGHAARGLAATISTQETFLLYPLLFSNSGSVSGDLRSRVEQDVVQKLGRRPALKEAIATLYTRAVDYDEKNRPLKSDADGYVRFWNWDDAEKKPKYIRMLVPAAFRLFAFRYASQAFRIAKPELDEYDAVRRLYLATLFERTAYLNGLDKPLDPAAGLDRETADLPPTQLERILDESLNRQRYGAARVAATLLGRQGDAQSLLDSPDGKPRALVRATTALDRRVRFAALEAVMTLKPEKPYPGSSLVSDALIWFSKADGQRLLVSINPKQSAAARTAGYFISCGYKGEPAVTGREGMKLAVDSPDVEIMVVDHRCSEPSASNLVQEMRNDCRTHDIPVAVLTSDPKALDEAVNTQTLPTMQKADRLNPSAPFSVSLSQVYPGVVNDAGAQWVTNDLLEKTGAEPVAPEVRLEQARKALLWLKEIVDAAEKGPKVYHFEELDDAVYRAIRSDVRIVQGLELAASIKSSAMQAAVYDVVADAVYPLELREKAAEEFERSIQRFGILLRGKQVQRLYDRYNASQAEPEETQKLLGRMIDLIEDKTFKQ